MDRLKRISLLLNTLREKQLNSSQIKLELFNDLISIRQIQRDLKDLEAFLSPNEFLSISKEHKIVYYAILKKTSSTVEIDKIIPVVSQTNFYKQIISEDIQKKLDHITIAIKTSKVLIIHEILNDETSDNSDFETIAFKFYPIRLIYHRDTYYLGGWNPKKGISQIFGVNQLNKINSTEQKFVSSKIVKYFDMEFSNRFGVTKNINNHVYDIKLEMSPVLAGFIKTHYWHHSQRFSKKNHNVVMHLKCGINRELMGWLFQWMYNIRIIIAINSNN